MPRAKEANLRIREEQRAKILEAAWHRGGEEEELMTVPIATPWSFYQGWDVYQSHLVKAIEPLTPDQLELRMAPSLRSIGLLAKVREADVPQASTPAVGGWRPRIVSAR